MAVPYGESAYIYGVHDRGGEHLILANNQAKGWVLVTEEIRANPDDHSGGHYKDLADQGLGVIVRLNHAYGSDGTIPHPSQYQNFARRVANFVKNSTGAHIWVIGNEMNFAREQPRKPGTDQPEPITPRLYAQCYQLCREAVHSLPDHDHHQILIGAPAPWNAETPYDADPQGKYTANRLQGRFGDFVKYLTDICLALGPGNCDGVAIHAYTHGTDPNLVFSDAKMGSPFEQYHYHFRTYRDYMNAIPRNMRHLPVYITEADEDDPWADVNNGWVKNAYKEINNWNEAGNQQIRAMILYRWPQKDKWNINGKLGVQEDFKEAIAKNYQWDPTARGGISMATTEFDYRTVFVNHNTPTVLPPGQTLTVSITIQNTGKMTWSSGGATPFRLGFQWYNAAGQMVTIPANFDFHTSLPKNVASGENVTLQAQLHTPDVPGSTYHLRWDMIHETVTWFTTQGDAGLLISPVTISPSVEISTTPTTTLTGIQINDISATLPSHPSNKYPQRTRAAIQRIILHHTATQANISVERIATYQVQTKGLAGITYHYCISEQGEVYQTQPLETASSHAGKYSNESVGVCLVGNFTSATPPQIQLDATAALLAQLAATLNLSVDQIVGYSDLVTTGSPGATWPTWKTPLLDKVTGLLAGRVSGVTPTPTSTPTSTTTTKPIEHYLLLWHRGKDNWAEWDLRGAIEYIGRFAPTVGFSVEQAKLAQYVTIIGGTGGVSAQEEQVLRAAGCQVERLAGPTETETRQMVETLVAQGQRFKTLR